MTARQLAAAEKLYHALTLLPCACKARYVGSRIVGLSRDCIRCKAMVVWEQAQEPKGLPPHTAAAEAALAELEEDR